MILLPSKNFSCCSENRGLVICNNSHLSSNNMKKVSVLTEGASPWMVMALHTVQSPERTTQNSSIPNPSYIILCQCWEPHFHYQIETRERRGTNWRCEINKATHLFSEQSFETPPRIHRTCTGERHFQYYHLWGYTLLSLKFYPRKEKS